MEVHCGLLAEAIDQALEKVWKPLFECKLPRKLHHYTSAESVLAIIRSRSIWATCLADQEDTTELSHSVALVKKYAELLIRETGSEFTADVLRRTVPMMEDRKPWFYIACFCEDAESRFHFKRYGRYCLTLNGPASGNAFLSCPVSNASWWYQRVNYDLAQQDSSIERALRACSQAISRFSIGVNEGPWKQSMVDSCAKIVAHRLLEIVLGFKRPEFIEDREWRLVCCPKINPLSSAPKMLDEEFGFYAKSDPRKHFVLTVPKTYTGARVPPIPFTKITPSDPDLEALNDMDRIRGALETLGETELLHLTRTSNK